MLGGGHGQLARRGHALVVPVGQQEVGQRLVVADQHLGGGQHQLAKGVEVGLLLVVGDPAQRRQVGHQRHVGVVREHLGDRADDLGAAEEADLEGRGADVLEDRAGLLDDRLGFEHMLVEDLGGVAHQYPGEHRQRVRAHRGDRRDVAARAAGAAGVADVEAQHARWRLVAGVLGGVARQGGFGIHGRGPAAALRTAPATRPATPTGCIQSSDHCSDWPRRERREDLDVPDLWLDLRRDQWRPGPWPRAGHALGRRADQLDLSRMRRAQGRLRDGRDLSAVAAGGGDCVAFSSLLRALPGRGPAEDQVPGFAGR